MTQLGLNLLDIKILKWITPNINLTWNFTLIWQLFLKVVSIIPEVQQSQESHTSYQTATTNESVILNPGTIEFHMDAILEQQQQSNVEDLFLVQQTSGR